MSALQAGDKKMDQEVLKLNDTTDDQLVMIKKFSAPKNLVFEALINHKHIIKWSSPYNMTVTFSQGDPKVGGKYKFGMKPVSNQGPERILIGKYKEIEDPNKLVYTQSYQMSDGKISPETVIDITLDEDNGKTQMIFQHSGFMSEKERNMARNGWEQAFDKLDSVVSSMS
jgi:uncharacterized protein YndB with AHSA1/START domain